jgi:hypothetical protein
MTFPFPWVLPRNIAKRMQESRRTLVLKGSNDRLLGCGGPVCHGLPYHQFIHPFVQLGVWQEHIPQRHPKGAMVLFSEPIRVRLF